MRPSPECVGPELSRSPCVPFVATLTRASAPVASSFTKTSATPFESPPTRFPALLSNAR